MDARRWPVTEECLLTVHIIVHLLKAWKVIVVGIECRNAAGAYLGGVLRVLEHPPQLGMHKIKYSLNYKHALGTYLIHPCITSLTAKFTKLEH